MRPGIWAPPRLPVLVADAAGAADLAIQVVRYLIPVSPAE